MKIALYPTSLDPITNGHLDIIQRSLRIFDHLVIGIGVHNKKIPLFSLDERVELAKQSINSLFPHEYCERLSIKPFTNLVVEFAEEIGAEFVIRGIRNNIDYEYEYSFAHINTRMAPSIEHVYFISGEQDHFISSSIVKELWSFGTKYKAMVPEPVYRALENKRR